MQIDFVTLFKETMRDMEEWKKIENTDGKILVSSLGRIKSLLRNGKILKTQLNKKGYHVVRVTINGIKRTIRVHREVAKAFVDNPHNYPQVNHIDGNKANNAATNLEWVTNRDNAIHAIKTGLWDSVIAGSIAENNRRKKGIIGISPTGMRKEYASVSEAERELDSRHISDVLKGKRKHVKGWTFSYKGVMS